jgi:aryl-alcohol dehydrogenase-like predicted oxidoreductase
MYAPKKRPLGGTGIDISELGFGAWPIGGTGYGPVEEREAVQSIEAYLDAGGNFIDTARRYGQSEAILGKAIGGGEIRERVVLASKTFMGETMETIPEIRRELEESLRALETDHVELYYLHMPPEDPDVMNRALDEMEILKQEGKIKAIGASIKGPEVTTETVDLCRQYIDSGRVDAIQVVYSILRQRIGEIFEYANKRGVGIVARTSIESGFLSGKYRPGEIIKADHRKRWTGDTQTRIFERVAELETYALRPPYRSMAQVAVRFSLEPKAVSSVIVGAKNAAQVRENMDVGALPPLDEDLIERLQNEFGGRTEAYNPEN